MRVLLDECVDQHLAHHFVGFEAHTVRGLGWHGIKNGRLLAKANDASFDAFITYDRGLAYQQDLRRYRFAIVLLRARTNRLRDAMPLVPDLLKALVVALRGQLTVVPVGD